MARVSPATSVRRPRMTSDREHELLIAVLSVLRRVGYEALTMDAVATEAHCSKATLYRMWQTKPAMVSAALYAARPADPSLIDTGTLRGDLVAFVESISLQAEADTPLVAALAHAALRDPELNRALTETRMTLDEVAVFIDRAVQRGELTATPAAAAFLPQMLFTLMFSRPLFEGSYATAEDMVRFVDDAVLPALLHS